MQQEPLDLVGIVIALLTYLVSKDAAIALGPYAAIVILSTAGAALALSGTEQEMTFMKSVLFVSVRIMLAVALTVVLADMLQKLVPWLVPRYSLSPIAFAIGWVRDYNQVRDFFGRTIERFVQKKTDE